MRYCLCREQQLNCTLETAWGFFSSPNNLSKITPAHMRFMVLSDLGNQPIHVGMKITYAVSPLFKIPMKWETKITQVDFKKSFTDFQQKGPYKYWSHFHEFFSNENGVLMKDTIDYELPFGWLGRIVHRVLVKKKLENIFNYRFRVLEEWFNKSIV